MIPELGRYTVTVASAYAVTILLLLGIVGQSLWRSAKVRRALEAQEKRMGHTDG